MIDETTQNLAALHALDLLPEPERSAFVRRLETEPELRRLVDQLREAAPAPALHARVLASVAATPAPPIAAPAHAENGARVLRFPAWIGWASLAAAAVLALVAADLRLDRSRLVARAVSAENETRLVNAELRAARNQLEAERLLAAAQNRHWKNAGAEADRLRAELPDTRTAATTRIDGLETRDRVAGLRIASLSALPGQPSDARGVAVWDPVEQQGVLIVSKLPALASDRDYQLWVVDPRYPRPVDGGVFTVDAVSGEARVVFKTGQPVREAARFTVSLERKGGAAVAEGPVVLAGR